jgi:hypothetical protein
MAEGFIRQRGTAWQVIVHAGRDPLIGKRRNLTGMARTKREAQALRAPSTDSGQRGQAACGHADVRGDRTPWTDLRPPTVCRPPARTHCGPCGRPADMATNATLSARNHC